MNNAGFQELWANHRAVGAFLLAILSVVAILARLPIRRRNATPRNDVEVRAWSYCARCGWPRGRKDAMDQAGGTRCLPSTLLLRGWCREAALDSDGRIVLPNDPTAVAWGLLGAANRAFEPGSSQWRAWLEHLDIVLHTRFGDTIGGRPMTVQRWNRDSSRTKVEVVEVAMEVEQLVGSATPSPPRRI